MLAAYLDLDIAEQLKMPVFEGVWENAVPGDESSGI